MEMAISILCLCCCDTGRGAALNIMPCMLELVDVTGVHVLWTEQGHLATLPEILPAHELHCTRLLVSVGTGIPTNMCTWGLGVHPGIMVRYPLHPWDLCDPGGLR